MLSMNQQAEKRLADDSENRCDEEDDFELAYFTNSYPQESDTTKTIVTAIKVVTALSILFEACIAGKLATGLFQYA